MAQRIARLGYMVMLSLTAAAYAQADEQTMVIVREVPSRIADRPEPKSPATIGVNTSPANEVKTGLSTIMPMDDSALAQGRGNVPSNMVNQALSPVTGSGNQTGVSTMSSNNLNNPTMNSAITVGTSRIAPAITGAINGAIMSGMGLSK